MAERLAWQQPRAIISGVLLVVIVSPGVRIWGRMIHGFRLWGAVWFLGERALLVSGTANVVFALLLMMMLVANTQAVSAPITLTTLYG